MGMLLAIVACFAMTMIFIQGLEDSSSGIEREVHNLRSTRRNMVSRIDRGVVKVKIRHCLWGALLFPPLLLVVLTFVRYQEFDKATERISTTIANAGSLVGEEVNKLSGIRSFLTKV